MDDAERDLFADTLRHATESHTGPALDAVLADLGWQYALSSDRRDAISVLFELQGEANATSSALDLVVLNALGGAGGTAGAVVLPPVGTARVPGELTGEQLVVHGVGTTGLATQGQACVVAKGPDGDGAFVVATTDLMLRPVEGVDPALGLVEVSATAVVPRGGAPVDWSDAVVLARLALAHELVGTARRMLALARDHALDRIQFGRPISTFQAVRHRLAETLVAIEAADAVLNAAWADVSAQSAVMAKAVAGRAARTSARHAQQVLAGIGFTTEHALHRYIRRTIVLDQLFGASRTLTREMGEDILRSRQLPPLQPL
jgi:hypothetical protein